ncbi:helix-turn-helix domain-containing protein [Christiangramia forsetii]|uniref:HTH cro/C1-type domain-containing protein n=2 Tax=Christiangramia forsetii TaxID=411153 RepID=A0LZR4_CHRFK|nr:helix-turn-helix domain-containing protein [Christiangramia forsetii]GGG46867.1 hypothetical protein GCM10011532_33490 [Christiangramia forsetii]CAL65859.1 hypothetical protein GFO_0885 [Christiangramia forsetii KT0803]CAL65874.1 hypothetical protein GFO_0900 [Christiangramia forsetii KT0803]
MKLLKTEEIVNEIKKKKITAYQIASETDLSEVGINKILNGQVKKPRKSTIKILSNYLNSSDNEKNSTPKTDLIDKRFEEIVAFKVKEIIQSDINELNQEINQLQQKVDNLISINSKLLLEISLKNGK